MARFINQRVVAVQVPHRAEPLATNYHVTWASTILILDADGNEHQRTLGFLPPEQLIQSVLLGTAKVHFDADRMVEALAALDELLGQHPHGYAIPEAMYLRGVCGYRLSRSRQSMEEAYEQLQTRFPNSEWTARISPYRG